jgi:hypothetical protein
LDDAPANAGAILAEQTTPLRTRQTNDNAAYRPAFFRRGNGESCEESMDAKMDVT